MHPENKSASSASSAESKRRHGQFFTTTNPFDHPAFKAWLDTIPRAADGSLREIVEPFAGSNNLIQMVRSLGFQNPWRAFDLDPVGPCRNSVPEVSIVQRDTIADFPKGFTVAITNPPYLARNSASKRALEYAGGEFEDLYMKALDSTLKSCDFVAAIIPDSFITSGQFRDRLCCVISLTCSMFTDTETPVCLALFKPGKSVDFAVWCGDTCVGSFGALKALNQPCAASFPWRFNDPAGTIGLRAMDDTKAASIAFCDGSEIPAEGIKKTSRSLTRISLPGVDQAKAALLIKRANRLLATMRSETSDVLMTSTKGLRADGKYRRRLEFAQARDLLNRAMTQMK